MDLPLGPTVESRQKKGEKGKRNTTCRTEVAEKQTHYPSEWNKKPMKAAACSHVLTTKKKGKNAERLRPAKRVVAHPAHNRMGNEGS